jgi:hypothetical protein
MSTVSMEPRSGHQSPPSHRPRPELFSLSMLGPSIIRSFEMLNPVRMAKNPVMFIAEVGAALTTLITAQADRDRWGSNLVLPSTDRHSVVHGLVRQLCGVGSGSPWSSSSRQSAFRSQRRYGVQSG